MTLNVVYARIETSYLLKFAKEEAANMNLFRMVTSKPSFEPRNVSGGIVRYPIDDLNNESVDTLVSNVIKYRVGRDPQLAQNELCMAENTIANFCNNKHKKLFLRRLREPREKRNTFPTLRNLWRSEANNNANTVFEIKTAYFESLETTLDLEVQEKKTR